VTTSLRSLRDAASAITEGYTTAAADVRAELGDGSYTVATVRHLRAEVQGLLDDVRTWRRDIDLVAVEDFQIGDRADDTWQLVRWEREARHQMGRLSYQLRRLWEMLEKLEQGAKRRLYVARSGDTLQAVAQATLGSWEEWPRLLEANPELVPGVLNSGTLLVIPERR